MLQIPDVDAWTGAEACYTYVTANALNCRRAPQVAPDNILDVFYKGDELIAYFRVGDWVLIQPTKPPIITGYCYAAHLAPCLTNPHS